MRTLTQSTCSVIPAHIQRHVAAHGDADQRIRAAATLNHTRHLAGQRTMVARGFRSQAATPGSGTQVVYDARNEYVLPGKVVMNDHGKESTDLETREAFAGVAATLDFLARVFQRKSIDDRGMTIISTVHYGARFDNAMWNGRQLVFGDGDGTLFRQFTKPVDVAGHEIAHGVTQFEAGLGYEGETGALNEHLSDVIGIMVKQFLLNQTVEQSDWLIGEGLYGPRIHGLAVRSMKAPGTAYDDPILGKDPQPAHMRDYVHTTDDNGGVHINSGILNRAFCSAASELGPFSWVVAGPLWYRSMRELLLPHAGFQAFADATVSMAGKLHGIGGSVQDTIRRAWELVGLPPAPSLLCGSRRALTAKR